MAYKTTIYNMMPKPVQGATRRVLAAAGFTLADAMMDGTSLVPTKDATAQEESQEFKYGEYTLNSERFKRYQQLTEIDPYIFSGVMDLALTLGKGFEVGMDEEKLGDRPEKPPEILKDAREFADKMHLQSAFAEAARLLVINGTVPIILGKPIDKEDESVGIMRLEFSPMPYTTLITRGFDLETNKAPESHMVNGVTTLIGPVNRVVLNEKTTQQKVFTEDSFVLMRYANENYEVVDRHSRVTVGVYGRSLLDALQATVKYRQNLLWCNDKATRRYGTFLLHFDYKALGDLIANRMIDISDAQAYMNAAAKEGKKLAAGSDIWTAGFNIDPITPTNNLDIMNIKVSLENDILNMLFSTNVGNGSSTTFASAYVSRQQKILGMESIRRTLVDGFEDILRRHLLMIGYGEKEVDTVIIKLDPIMEPEVASSDIIALNQSGKLRDSDMFDLFGWTCDPVPEDEQLAKQREMLKLQSEFAPQPASAGRAKGEVSGSGKDKAGPRAEKSAYNNRKD